MNKFLKLFTAFSLLLITKNTFADCSYTDKANMNKLAANVKIDYEIKTKTIDSTSPDFNGEDPSIVLTVNYLDLVFTNISKELYVTGTEKNSGEEITVLSSDLQDGKKVISYEDTSFIRKYTFKVIASDESSCSGETLKTIYVTMPMRNPYSEYCGDEETDFYLCKPFITTTVESYNTFYKQYEDYNNKQGIKTTEEVEKEKWYNKIINTLDDYKYFILGGVILVSGTFVVIKVIKIKKQRELGL